MQTYEGSITIKWYKNDSGGDKRPLTLDVRDERHLKEIQESIRQIFLNYGDDDTLPNPKNNGKVAYSVSFNLTQRL